MRLALALGKSVRETLQSMDSRELSEWLAYDNLFLLPDPYRASAGVSQTVAAAMSGKRLPASEFMPTRPPADRDDGDGEIEAVKFAAFASAHNRGIEAKG